MDLREIKFGIEIETIRRTRQAVAEAIRTVVGGAVRHAGYPSSLDPWEVTDPQGRVWKVVADGSLTSVPGHLRAEVVCGTTRKGKFIVVRRPMQKRVRRTLAAIKEGLRRRLHHAIVEVGQWLGTVMRGWYQYYAVPLTSPHLGAFRTRVGRPWYGILRRRSHKTRITWERMHRLIARWLPEPRILHPYPWERLRV